MNEIAPIIIIVAIVIYIALRVGKKIEEKGKELKKNDDTKTFSITQIEAKSVIVSEIGNEASISSKKKIEKKGIGKRLFFTKEEELLYENSLPKFQVLVEWMNSTKDTLCVLSKIKKKENFPFRELYFPMYFDAILRMIQNNPKIKCHRIFQLPKDYELKSITDGIEEAVTRLNDETIDHLLQCFKYTSQFYLFLTEYFVPHGFIIIDKEYLIHKKLNYVNGKPFLMKNELYHKDSVTFQTANDEFLERVGENHPNLVKVKDFINVMQKLMDNDNAFREEHKNRLAELRDSIPYPRKDKPEKIAPFKESIATLAHPGKE